MNKTKAFTRVIGNGSIESTTTDAVRVCDLILCHGGIFQVFEIKEFPAKSDSELPVFACLSRFVCDSVDGVPCAVPNAWRIPHWNIQGNRRAIWSRVKRDSADFARLS